MAQERVLGRRSPGGAASLGRSSRSGGGRRRRRRARRRAHRARQPASRSCVLEAKGRIGGRAQTDTATSACRGTAAPTGCTRRAATRSPLSPMPRVRLRAGDAAAPPVERRLGRCRAARRSSRTTTPRAFAAIGAAGAAGLDVAAVGGDPAAPALSRTVRLWSAALNGADPERVSTLDHARYELSGGNWRVADGYRRPGRPLRRRHAGRARDAARAHPLGRQRGPRRHRRAGPLRGRAAIVTASTNVLATRPDRVRSAAARPAAGGARGVPVGEANKVALAFDGQRLRVPPDAYFLHIEHRTP